MSNDNEEDIEDEPDTHILTKTTDYTTHSDLTGQMPIKSRRGNKYMLVSVYNNYVYNIPMTGKSGPEYVKAYKELFAHFKKRGVKPKAQRIDNETSRALTNYLESDENITMEYVPPHSHRANKAERAVRDSKNHLIATIATADPDFPMDLWDESQDQLNITMNLLRPYGPDPTKSAYEGMHGKHYDFNRYPLAPFGTAVLIHDAPKVRGTWAPHGTPGYDVGPALDGHYRCYRSISISTGRERITDTVEWLPIAYRVPGSSGEELILAATRDVERAFQTIIDNKLISPRQDEAVTNTQQSLTTALHKVIELFHPTREQRVPAHNRSTHTATRGCTNQHTHRTPQPTYLHSLFRGWAYPIPILPLMQFYKALSYHTMRVYITTPC